MSGKNSGTAAYRLALSGLMVALMLVLGYLESLIPSIGVPGIRLGLSNSVLIFAVYLLGLPNAFILMTLKVVLSGLLFSGVTAMIYAFAGGLLSLTVMILLSRIPKMPVVAVSMAGGLFHNIGQMAVAMLVLHTPKQILGYFAVLCAAGVVCGLLTGIAAKGVMRYLSHSSLQKFVPEKNPGKDTLLILAAVVLTAAGIALALNSFLKTTPTAVVTEPADSGSGLMSIEDLPLPVKTQP